MAIKRNASGLTPALHRPSLDNEELVSSEKLKFIFYTVYTVPPKQLLNIKTTISLKLWFWKVEKSNEQEKQTELSPALARILGTIFSFFLRIKMKVVADCNIRYISVCRNMILFPFPKFRLNVLKKSIFKIHFKLFILCYLLY